MSNTPKITDLETENGVISSISLNLDKQRFDEQFESFFSDGSIRADMYSLRADLDDTFVDKLSDSINPLRGQKAEVFSDGTKIAEGTFNQETGMIGFGTGQIDFNLDFNEDMIQRGGYADGGIPSVGEGRFPLFEDLSRDIDSGEDFAEAFDIRNLTLKVVKEAQDKVKNPSPSEAAEAAKDKVKNTSASEAAEAANKYKGIIQLGVLAVGIAGTVGAYVWGKN